MTLEEMERLRDAWRRYWRSSEKWRKDLEKRQESALLEWRADPSRRFVAPTYKLFPRVPAEFQRLICGARTRFGTPCKRRDLYRSGRCRLHGGLSTGPRSQAGKARSAMNAGRGMPERSPCDGQGYGKVDGQGEPHVMLTKPDLVSPASGSGVSCSWSVSDGL